MARNVLKASAVRLMTSPILAAAHSVAGQQQDTCAVGGGSASIRFVRQGDLVEGVEVTCACGRVTRFDCLYGGDDAAEEPTP